MSEKVTLAFHYRVLHVGEPKPDALDHAQFSAKFSREITEEEYNHLHRGKFKKMIADITNTKEIYVLPISQQEYEESYPDDEEEEEEGEDNEWTIKY